MLRAAIFLLLSISFMRVDIAALRAYMRRPGVVLAATAWSMLVVPLVVGSSASLPGSTSAPPMCFSALMLQAVASPMMAAPAFAALMGLDATLVLITLVTGMALVPFTAPIFAYVFYGAELTLSPLALGVKLFAILAGSLAGGRGDPPPRRRRRHRAAPRGRSTASTLCSCWCSSPR